MTRRISVYNYPHARKKQNSHHVAFFTVKSVCRLVSLRVPGLSTRLDHRTDDGRHNCKKVHNDQILILWATRATRKPLIT